MKASTIAFVVVVLAAAIGFGLYYQSVKQQISHPSPSVSTAKPESPETAPSEQATQTVKIYRVGIEKDEEVLRPVEVKVSSEHPIQSTLEELLKHDNSGKLANPIPEGTRLLGVNVKNKTAIVDFSHEFADNFHGSSETETMIIESILQTLGQFPEVKRVRLLVEGKSIDTLGHLDLSGTLDLHSLHSGNGEQD